MQHQESFALLFLVSLLHSVRARCQFGVRVRAGILCRVWRVDDAAAGHWFRLPVLSANCHCAVHAAPGLQRLQQVLIDHFSHNAALLHFLHCLLSSCCSVACNAAVSSLMLLMLLGL